MEELVSTVTAMLNIFVQNPGISISFGLLLLVGFALYVILKLAEYAFGPRR